MLAVEGLTTKHCSFHTKDTVQQYTPFYKDRYTKSVITTKRYCLAKRVRFADEEGGKLCVTRVYESSPPYYRPATSHLKIENRIKSYKVVYDETRLFLKNICVVAFGIVSGKSVFGAIAVRNISYEKSVIVRFTTDCWKTCRDIPAKYIRHEYDGLVDQFIFILPLGEDESIDIESNLEFAVRYTVNGVEYWDNNREKNYGFVFKPTEILFP